MNALRALIAPLSREGRFFSEVKVSGAHSESLAMISRAEADVAAIDCVTYALLRRYRPSALAGTRPLCRTASAPVGPYVTRVDRDMDFVTQLRAALVDAFDDPHLASARDDLLLGGVEMLPASAYNRLTRFERFAAERGYAELQ
jgi:ABC-type phosphate/phosphonate transport system substrate-binding protein